MELPLTVGLDGSEPGFAALDWAVDEAALHRCPLRVVYASRWEWYDLAAPTAGRSSRGVGHGVVESAARRAGQRNPDVKVETEVVADDPAQALIRESRTAWALVTGARGRGGFAGLLLGSVGLAVAARALCPVVVVRGDGPGRRDGRHRVLLGVSDTPGATEAVRFALREASARDCALEAVRAWRCPPHDDTPHPALADGTCLYHRARADTLLDEALARARQEEPSSPELHRVLVEGPAHKVLLAGTAAADLVVVGTYRHPHQPGLQLGRIAHVLLHHARCPVVVVPRVEGGVRA
ncbi:universal stress protein [Streptomyces sp. NPDC093225]|uniref:universal stress protein n=1 Tax=Streptomyces sp. NPDC093225 TaxID=3366034 RepID=UPI003817076B